MSSMSQRNRRLFITIMVIALLQMIQFALTPGIAKIQSEVFPQISLSTVQTVMMLPSLLSMVFSLLSAFLIHKGWVSKKAAVVIGIMLLALTGFTSIVLHTQIWHLILFSSFIGASMGFFISNTASIMFDNFNEQERRMSVGVQTSAINIGGIFFSVVGGYLASLIWYGGYLLLVVAAPIVVLCILTIPNDRKERQLASARTEHHTARSKIPLDIFYYGFIVFVFMLVFAVGSTNISNHIMAAGFGNTAMAGIAMAIQMAGGVFIGFIFSRISSRLKDYMIPLGFVVIFIGYMIISLGVQSLAVSLVGVFIAGTAISLIVPQTMFATSNLVDASNSASSTALISCICPGMGSFLSPMLFTNLTMKLGGESTVFRFKFVAIVALVCGMILLLTTWYRNHKSAQQELPVATAAPSPRL